MYLPTNTIGFLMRIIFIVALYLISLTANGEEIAYMHMKEGGNVFLTDEPCNVLTRNFPNLKFAFIWNQTKRTDGCYGIKNGKVAMLFVQESSSPLQITYSGDEFNLLTNKKLQ